MGRVGSYIIDDKEDKIKNSKPFYIKDLIIYACILILAVIFILLFVLPNGATESDGFKVVINGKEALTYYYNGEYILNPDFENKIVMENKTIKIFIGDDKKEYNVLSFDSEKQTVKMKESSCPMHDCELMEGEIYCAPHSLKVTSVKLNKDITVG